jgi:hypothetical protein
LAAQGFELWRERRGGGRAFLGALALYALFGASWAVYLQLKTVAAGQEVPLADADFYNLLFYFRNPNHYQPAAFLLRAYLLTGGLLVVAGYVFYRMGQGRALAFLGAGLGLFLLATANALWLQNFSLSALQFFKMAIWLKFLGVVAACAGLERQRLTWLAALLAFGQRRALTLSLLVLAGAGLLFASSERFRLRYEWPGRYALQLEADICRQARLLSGPEAVFAHPFGFTRFHYHAQRSSFVCFKAVSREKGYILPWAERLQLLYGISLANAERGSALAAPADAHYARLDFAAAQRLKAAGLTHLIAFRDHPIPGLKVLGENGGYRIYEL